MDANTRFKNDLQTYFCGLFMTPRFNEFTNLKSDGKFMDKELNYLYDCHSCFSSYLLSFSHKADVNFKIISMDSDARSWSVTDTSEHMPTTLI